MEPSDLWKLGVWERRSPRRIVGIFRDQARSVGFLEFRVWIDGLTVVTPDRAVLTTVRPKPPKIHPHSNGATLARPVRIGQR